MLEEEKRVIHALRRGVEKQDYATVKAMLIQAEKMGLSGEEVKQAQAMRLRIEVKTMRRAFRCIVHAYTPRSISVCARKAKAR